MFFTYPSHLIVILLKHPTWRLSDVITSNLNLIVWLWRFPCLHRHGATMSMRAPWRFSYHIHYIFSGLCFHLIIYGYRIFLPLNRTIYYLRTMSTYDLFISVSSTSVSTLDYTFSSSVSTLDPILFVWSNINHISNSQRQGKSTKLKTLGAVKDCFINKKRLGRTIFKFQNHYDFIIIIGVF